MKSLLNYFLNRPVVTNAIMFGVMISAALLWNQVGKEEMPEFAMNWIRATVRYPGASAHDIELFITKPIEEKLKGVSDLDQISSTSAYGSSTISIDFKPNLNNLQEKIQEVKDAIDSVDFPSEADDPIYRQFRSSEKAIIDIGIYLKNKEILNVEDRQVLQKYALAFKNKILSLSEISGVTESGYLRPELQVKVKPDLLSKYEVSLNQVKSEIVGQNIRRPIGSMKDKTESEVSIVSELDSVDSLKRVIISSGFQGQSLNLSDIAAIEEGFEENSTVIKVQGKEGIIFNIQKSTNIDILSAQKAVVNFIDQFKNNDPNSPVGFVLIDDESYDVKNRLSLIGSNGLIGFVLIIIVLFLFLDFKSGIWVAMGIPFSLAFTLIISMVLGYTINNMTLAAIIIVLGIVVDDAIIVAENISRKLREDPDHMGADAVGEVGAPVIASVLTTCAAFIPLYFFSGRFGLFVKWIPGVIFLMLLASLIESFLILPSHMIQPLKLEIWFNKVFVKHTFTKKREAFLEKIESIYSNIISFCLKHRFIVLFGFISLLSVSGYIFQVKMNYVMFPREESRDFRLKVVGPKSAKRYDMAKMVRSVEDIFLKDDRGIVTSVRTSIGQNRRGGEVRENEASVRVEITPPSERSISYKKLIEGWKKKTEELTQFEEIRFQKSRFGSDSGSPIAIQIQENNDINRSVVVNRLVEKLKDLPELINIEIEKPVTKVEYKLNINKKEVSRLGIDFSDLSTTLRAYIEGDILYTLNSGEEEVDLRFTGQDKSKNDINKLLELTIANQNNYLVPIKNLVSVEKRDKEANISRVNFKRATMVYADIAPTSKITPLEIAEVIEKDIFNKVLEGMPTTNLKFRGEVEDSRESQSDFSLSIFLVLGLIYLLLIFLFDSFWTPLLIGAIIPFGVVGTILAFWSHGLSHYGFFAVVGTLGMIGVVINDSIVLIDKLNNSLSKMELSLNELKERISMVSATRLRAIIITTFTTVAGLFPTAYGLGGYDSMLAEMMLAMGWGLLFGMFITLILVPCIYSLYGQLKFSIKNEKGK